MKILKDYSKLRKCDPFGVFSAGISTAGSIETTQMSIDANQEENAKNRKFASAEAEKQRQWSTEEWQRQWNQQSQEWYNQQNFMNEYNSPVEQNKRLIAAGMNPGAMAAGSNAAGLTSASSVPTVAVPAGASASAPPGANVAGATNYASAFGDIANGIGSLVKSLSGARKDNAEADRLEKTLETYINQELAKYQNQQLVNAYQEMYNTFFSEKAPKELKKLGAEIRQITANAILAENQADLVEEQTVTEQLKQYLTNNQIKISDQEYIKLCLFVQRYGELLDSEIARNRSEVVRNRASAQESVAHAGLYDELAVSEDVMRSLRMDLMSDEHTLNIETLDSKVRTWANNADASALNVFNEKLKAYDLQAYNALQRLLHGKASQEDRSLLLDIFRGVSDADRIAIGSKYSWRNRNAFRN